MSAFNQPSNPLTVDLLEFLIDREARNLSPKTLLWYEQSLTTLCRFLNVTDMSQVTPSLVRRFVLHLHNSHNPGGVRNILCAVKAYLRWYSVEHPEWNLPTVPTPKVPDEPLEPVSLEHVRLLLSVCKPRTFTGDRDKAIILTLLDSGIRHQELVDLNRDDLHLSSGTLIIRSGKGRKTRTTFVGAKTRQAVLRYLRHCPLTEPLWLTRTFTRLSYTGAREILRRRSNQAGIPEPSLHSFRRAFAICSLRAGMDLITLQRLLGHTSLAVVSRYLKQVDDDLAQTHRQTAPVDTLL